MIADISFIERRIEEKNKAVQKKIRAKKRAPLTVFLALAIMVTGTLGGYLTLSQAATATRNKPLIFQGRITDANYVPLADTSSRRMAFRIYDAAGTGSPPSGGNCLWSTGTTNTGDTPEAANCATTFSDSNTVLATITRGVFTVALGDSSVTNMPDLRLDFNSASYYLEITVRNDSGTYETLAPRVRIGATSYAYNADELDGITSSQFLGGATFNPVPSSSTTLNGALDASATTITVVSTSGYPVSGTLLIAAEGANSNEIVTYTGTTSATFTGVTRGRHGTSGAIHGTGAAVSNYLMIVASSATAAPLLTLTGGGAISQAPATSGTPSAITFTGAAHTGLTASTESTDINFNLNRTVTFATGDFANSTYQRAIRIQAPTYNFATASTIPNAATLSIDNLPIPGGNATITNRHGLMIRPTTSSASNYFGIWSELQNLAVSPGFSSYNMYATTPSVSNGGNTDTETYAWFLDGYLDGTNRLAHTAGTGTDNWYGLRMYMPQQAGGTATSRGISIERPAIINGGATYALTTNEAAGNVGFGDLTPDFNLEILSSSTTADGGILITKTDTSDRDPIIQFSLADGGAVSYTMGVDDSVTGDPLKISTTALGTGDMLILDSRTTTGAVSALSISPPSGASISFAEAANSTYTTLNLSTPALSISGATVDNITSSWSSYLFQQPGDLTHSASGVTINDAATMRIGGPQQVAGGVNITNDYALRIEAGESVASVGTVTNAYGLYVDKPTGGSNNYAAIFEGAIGTPLVGIGTATPRTALDVDGTMAFGAMEAVSISGAGSQISTSASTVYLLSTAGDNSYTLGADSVLNGVSAQIIMLMVDSTETNTITIRDHSINSSNVQTAGDADRVLGARDILVLLFDGGDWVEVSYSNN